MQFAIPETRIPGDISMPRTGEESIRRDEKYYARKCWFSAGNNFLRMCLISVLGWSRDILEASKARPLSILIFRIWKMQKELFRMEMMICVNRTDMRNRRII